MGTMVPRAGANTERSRGPGDAPARFRTSPLSEHGYPDQRRRGQSRAGGRPSLPLHVIGCDPPVAPDRQGRRRPAGDRHQRRAAIRRQRAHRLQGRLRIGEADAEAGQGIVPAQFDPSRGCHDQARNAAGIPVRWAGRLIRGQVSRPDRPGSGDHRHARLHDRDPAAGFGD